MEIFRKTDTRSPSGLELEADGLIWLGEAMAAGGALTVPVITRPTAVRPVLEIARIREVAVTPQAARAFGRALAHTHAAGAPSFGCAPCPDAPPVSDASESSTGLLAQGMSELSTGQESATATIVGRYGESQQVILAPTPHSPGTWGAWFAEHRVACMIPRARDNGSLSASGASLIEKVADRIASGEFDAPQPSLVTGAVARIHGDLWSGNVLWARAGDLDWALPQAGRGARGKEDPQPASEKRETTSSSAHDVVGVLIDPMAHGGHAETDLAHLGVFGQPYLDDIYAGYQEVSALAPNWEERVGLSVLHMIVMHAAIFGGGYGLEATHIARRYV